MNLDQITSFLKVIEHKSFKRAADYLYLTPTALGHRVSNLEQELGVSLFLRNRGIQTVTLTAEGSAFVPIAEEMQRLWERALNLSGATARTDIQISCGTSFYELFIPAIYPKLLEAGFSPSFSCSNRNSSLHDIESGRIDFAIHGGDTPSNDDIYLTDTLATEPLIFISRADSPYSDEITVSELDPKNEVMTIWNSAFTNWHNRIFGELALPRISFGSTRQAAQMLASDPLKWAVIPATAYSFYAETGSLKRSVMDAPPPGRSIFLLSKLPLLSKCHDIILTTCDEVLAATPGVVINQN